MQLVVGMNSIGEDIDECKTIANLCENGQCINTLGSYRLRSFLSLRYFLNSGTLNQITSVIGTGGAQ